MTNQTDILAMTPEQLRIEIAKEKGWTQIKDTGDGILTGFLPNGGWNPDYVPHYTESILDAWELESEIPNGIGVSAAQYVAILYRVLQNDPTVHRHPTYSVTFPSQFDLIHATAEQRSRAWLILKRSAK